MHTLIIVILMMGTDAPAAISHVEGFKDLAACTVAATKVQVDWAEASHKMESLREDLRRNRALALTTTCVNMGMY